MKTQFDQDQLNLIKNHNVINLENFENISDDQIEEMLDYFGDLEVDKIQSED